MPAGHWGKYGNPTLPRGGGGGRRSLQHEARDLIIFSMKIDTHFKYFVGMEAFYCDEVQPTNVLTGNNHNSNCDEIYSFLIVRYTDLFPVTEPGKASYAPWVW